LDSPDDLYTKLQRIGAERQPLYAEADIHISIAKNLPPEAVVEQILTAIPTVLKTPAISPS
jgi:shikimate kinase